MGYISTILTALLCATGPLASADQLGKETVLVVREAYQKGEYNDFFSEGDVDEVIQLRKQQIPAGFEEKWEARFLDLQKEKSKALLSALSDRDDSVFANKVRSAAATFSTPAQEKAISKLNSLIAKGPNTGANQDENTLIDIDIEYEAKLMHAQFPDSLALRMEKMDKMVAASKNFQDHELKQAVGLAAANLDVRLARNLDGAELNALVKNKAEPSNETEAKVYEIIAIYQEKFADLMKELEQAK